jgi:hypothetical protein
MYGNVLSPFSTAFLAKRPAAISTSGFEVFVHEVIAAITRAPCLNSYSFPSLKVNLATFP